MQNNQIDKNQLLKRSKRNTYIIQDEVATVQVTSQVKYEEKV